mmetsp:Transcript_3215/g.3871  ORF Transcript_3215/g.3871 Transcript_3215/m.3871 type:complete len:240 (+) Transcript_3215:285-1004(+)
MCADDRIIAKAQMNQSWYDTHMKMKRKRNEIGVDKQTPIATDDENDTDGITRLMGMFDVPDLQDRLFASQQELCAYHTMLDEMEELKAANKQLECEAAELLKERSSHKQTLKKDAYNAVERLENEIVGLKMELAQSRAKEDSHKFKIQTLISEKLTLEETAKYLRERARMYAAKEINRDPIVDEFQKHNIQTVDCEKRVSRKSSILLLLYTEAMRDCRQKLEMEVINAECRQSAAAVTA